MFFICSQLIMSSRRPSGVERVVELFSDHLREFLTDYPELVSSMPLVQRSQRRHRHGRDEGRRGGQAQHQHQARGRGSRAPSAGRRGGQALQAGQDPQAAGPRSLSRRDAMRLRHALEENATGRISQENLQWLRSLAERPPRDPQPAAAVAPPPPAAAPPAALGPQGELRIFDAHFHLHSRYKNMHTIPQLLNSQVVIPKINAPIMGGLVNFCDPSEIPLEHEIDDIIGGLPYFKISCGIHPQHAHKNIPNYHEVLGRIGSLLNRDKIHGVGEIGFQNITPSNVRLQERVVEDLIKLARPNQLIVLHIRGEAADFCSERTYHHTVRFLSERLPTDQMIQLHCFTGTPQVVHSFQRNFPNSFFSIGGLCTSYNDTQKQALRIIPSNRIVLETDSPYLSIYRNVRNHPGFLGDIAEKVGEIRNIPLKDILRENERNFKIMMNIS